MEFELSNLRTSMSYNVPMCGRSPAHTCTTIWGRDSSRLLVCGSTLPHPARNLLHGFHAQPTSTGQNIIRAAIQMPDQSARHPAALGATQWLSGCQRPGCRRA
jgi:hypothetical protein